MPCVKLLALNLQKAQIELYSDFHIGIGCEVVKVVIHRYFIVCKSINVIPESEMSNEGVHAHNYGKEIDGFRCVCICLREGKRNTDSSKKHFRFL